ncbi:MAG: hypothetical protein KIS66_08840 [Fimbriimonadaceae bacterium]|nr:hypothetical protein [Fimbriimonadaceae bacterium]
MERLASAVLSLFAAALAIGMAPVTAQEVTDRLHRHYVKVFHDLTLTTERTITVVENGKRVTKRVPPQLGFSRLPTVGPHPVRPYPDDPADRPYLQEARRRLVVHAFGYGADGATLNERNLRAKRLVNTFMGGPSPKPPTQDQATEFLVDRIDAVLAGKPAVGQIGPWRVEAKRVALGRSACLKCHDTSKVGDPVAAIVYFAAPKPAKRG